MVGHTSLWMFPIYGAGGVLLELIYGKIEHKRWFERGLIWIYVIFGVEFISGFILRIAGIEAWRYDSLFSVAGLIRLDYAPLWFLVGMIFEKLRGKIIFFA